MPVPSSSRPYALPVTTVRQRVVDGLAGYPQAVSAPALADLFAAIDTTYFHPHPMTPAEAKRIAAYDGQDVYLVSEVDGVYVAYGMLRGWDEGYAVPSLGIAVRRDAYGQGYGRAMMAALHEAARARGATSVRLRVHPANGRARSLYESLGYVDQGEERGERLMTLEL